MDSENPQPPLTLRQRINIWLDYNQVSLKLESWYPAALGLVFLIGAVLTPVSTIQFDKLTKDVAPIVISVAAIFAGFQGAIQAIILAMASSRVVRQLREKNRLDYLMAYIRSGTTTLVAFVVLATLVVALRTVDAFPLTHVHIVTALLAGIFVWSMAASVRIMFIMLKLIRLTANQA